MLCAFWNLNALKVQGRLVRLLVHMALSFMRKNASDLRHIEFNDRKYKESFMFPKIYSAYKGLMGAGNFEVNTRWTYGEKH